jgi:uncharacterized membrane protein
MCSFSVKKIRLSYWAAFIFAVHFFTVYPMVYPSHIDVKKSISKRRLVVKRGKLDKITYIFDASFFTALCILVIFMIATVYDRQDIDSENDEALA